MAERPSKAIAFHVSLETIEPVRDIADRRLAFWQPLLQRLRGAIERETVFRDREPLRNVDALERIVTKDFPRALTINVQNALVGRFLNNEGLVITRSLPREVARVVFTVERLQPFDTASHPH
jgi:hypothetical protein